LDGFDEDSFSGGLKFHTRSSSSSN
jgi:hypothetical protein